jgi:nucleotide-binding universal stress UspA family protein
MTEQTVERRVVVGVDGSPAARDAVRFAAREAALRKATLVAVTAVELPDYAWIDPYAVREHPGEGFVDQALDRLGLLLAEIGTGDVPVRTVVSTESPSVALAAQSTGAELLVVGSRGRGGFRGMVLGSVSLQCVLHAHCPVTVVRPEPRSGEKPAAAEHTLADTRRDTTPTFI